MDVVDVMTRNVVTTSPDSTIRQAARLMIDGGFSGLPVVDDGHLVGVISEADFVERDGSQSWASRVLHGDSQRPLRGVEKVAELMSTPAVTVNALATVQEAARLMTRKGLKRLPVVDRKGHLAGIVTRRDLIASYVRPDADVADEIRALLAVLPTPLSGVEVAVEDGVVKLTGEVDDAKEANAVGRVAQVIEGVARVVNEVDWPSPQLGDAPSVESLV